MHGRVSQDAKTLGIAAGIIVALLVVMQLSEAAVRAEISAAPAGHMSCVTDVRWQEDLLYSVHEKL
jgi:hypothetical protein